MIDVDNIHFYRQRDACTPSVPNQSVYLFLLQKFRHNVKSKTYSVKQDGLIQEADQFNWDEINRSGPQFH